MAVYLLLMGFGGWYLGTYSGNWDPLVYNEKPGAAVGAQEADEGPPDPMVLGKRVYNNCISCHQADGQGVEGSYPPLVGSEWVLGSTVRLSAILLHGLEGEIVVLGETYNEVMPAWSHLSDLQIASVMTYVRNSWGNEAEPVSEALVADVREQTADRSAAWTSPELDTLMAELGDLEAETAVAEGDEGDEPADSEAGTEAAADDGSVASG
jgi:mono/diheme cytochrome c family protein